MANIEFAKKYLLAFKNCCVVTLKKSSETNSKMKACDLVILICFVDLFVNCLNVYTVVLVQIKISIALHCYTFSF